MTDIEKLTAAVAKTKDDLDQAREALAIAQQQYKIAREALAICTLADKHDLRIDDKIRIVERCVWSQPHEGKTGIIDSVGWYYGDRLEIRGRLFKKDGTLGSRTFATAHFEKV